MLEITVLAIVAATLTALIGVVVGWLVRGKRCAREKTAINAGWQEQFEAQRVENNRLAAQSRNLMQQVSQFQASSKDASNRARELSIALKEAFDRRDQLQRETKDIRSNLDTVVAERHRFKDELQKLSEQRQSLMTAIKEKDDKIFALSRQLESWQERLPPLIQRFRDRNEDAQKLEIELAESREKIHGLESVMGSDQTRVEPVDPDSLSDGLDASNDPHGTDNDSDDPTDDGQRNARAGNGSAHINPHLPGNKQSDIEEPVGLRDDLKQIKGVGPAIEKTLNELGFYRFSQIAEMSAYEIDQVARQLKGFKSRIYREDWIGQARNLQYRQ